jgi:hypothetical protein
MFVTTTKSKQIVDIPITSVIHVIMNISHNFCRYIYITTVTMYILIWVCTLVKWHTGTQTIRECNVTGLVITVNPLIQLACLSLEHQNLIAYKGYYNVFCHLCNTNENTVKLCIDDNFLLLFNLEFTTMDSMINKCSTFVSHNDLTVQSILCRICTSRGSGFGGSEYRKIEFPNNTYHIA